MVSKPRLEALRKSVKKVINAKGKKQREVALNEFNIINDDGWETCAVGSFLNDCGINVSQMAVCRDTDNSSIVSTLVKPEIKVEGYKFETNVSGAKLQRLNALKFLNKLIRSKPCNIMKI